METLKNIAKELAGHGTKSDFPPVEQPPSGTLEMLNGCPVFENTNVLTAGPKGPALLMDIQYLQKMGHFNREKIPERIVHAHGTGAYGTFTHKRYHEIHLCQDVELSRKEDQDVGPILYSNTGKGICGPNERPSRLCSQVLYGRWQLGPSWQ